MKKIYSLVIFLLMTIITYSQISITTLGNAITQDFNTLANSGTSSVLPTGWTFLETGTGANTTYAADAGGTNSGNSYSYGTPASTERAFGGLLSGSVTPLIGASFTNNTLSTITSLAISYTGEQWRLGATGRADRLDFSYGINATSLTAGTYVVEPSLSFTAPTTTGTVGAIDGNLSANRTSVTFTISNISITSGSTFWIKWTDLNANGSDDGLSIDDFSITANPDILPPCAELTEQPTNFVLTATSGSVSGIFDLIQGLTSVQNYFVVKSLSPSLTQLPVDGILYASGQTINGGNGLSVGVSVDGNFVDNNVSPSTPYYYFVFAMEDQSCSGGPNYNQVTPLTGTITTPALAACSTPLAPTALVLTPANTTVSGAFTASGASKYLVIKSTVAPPLGAMPIDGTIYTTGQPSGNGTVVTYTNTANFAATGLTVSTPYYFYVFAANDACTGAPFYSASSLDGNTTTTNVATGIPAGYYDPANGLTAQPLKTALKNIITNGSQVLSYTPGLWNIYQFSDLHRNDANTADIIWDMYSDNPTGPEPYTFTYGTNQCGSYSTEGNCYNREHSTPQSFFNQLSPMVSDAHHIFPTDGEVNNMRSNFPYGEVTNLASVPAAQNNPSLNGSKLGTGTNFGYNATVFEPIDAYKGDFARACLYMVTRYEDEIISQNWSSLGTANALFLSTTDETNAAKRRLQIYDAWQLKTLVKWHNQDPVSQKEIDRNNAIYYTTVNTTSTGTPKVQSNRNPFVDHPEYVAAIFNATGLLPVTVTNFTAQKLTEAVLLKWHATAETGLKQFDIERSVDGIKFNTIGSVEGRNLPQYSFTDNILPNATIVYYRLKIIDADGKFKNSNIVAIKLNKNFPNAMVYPNPTIGELNIRLYEPLFTNSTLQVLDVTGRLVKQQNVSANNVILLIDVKDLSAGRYFIKIANSKQVINQSFVVVK
jgi:endonuclease I